MICFAHEKGPLPSSFLMLDRLEAVLDRELAESIREGSLSPAQHGGVAVGVGFAQTSLHQAFGKA